MAQMLQGLSPGQVTFGAFSCRSLRKSCRHSGFMAVVDTESCLRDQCRVRKNMLLAHRLAKYWQFKTLITSHISHQNELKGAHHATS